MSKASDQFDVAVLGAGPGGYVAALRAALRGATVCLVEKSSLGGTCLNVGCIPTKAMLHASELVHASASLGLFGISAEPASVDGPAFMLRVAGTVTNLRKGIAGLLKARKVQVVQGRGRLIAPDCVEVDGEAGPRHVRAGAIIIATGSRPGRPGFLPWEAGNIWTTDEATTAERLPESAIVMGGGIIGCEFATVYSELGIPTTVVEMMDRLVPDLDADASEAIARSLKERHVNVITGARAEAVEASDAEVVVHCGAGRTIQAERLLVCVGRRPNVEDLGLEALGVELADGVIAVDARCRTSIDGVYAVGDVAETRQYAHLASRMGIVAADNATGHDAQDDRTVVPAGVHTHPQVAAVGLSEAQAAEESESARVASFPLAASGMAQACGQTAGQVKIIACERTGAILGGLIIAPGATELIQEIALAMRHGLTVEQVAETIHAHPTFAESIAEAAESWLGLPLHSLR